jgi:hypothetical protein
MSSLTNTQINSKSMNGLINVEANTGTFDNLNVNSLNVLVSGTAPTVSPLSNDTNIATTAWVTNHAQVGTYVDLINNQTIVSGIKTFNTLPQSSVVPTLGDEFVNKSFTDATYVDLTTNQTIVSGIKTFNTLPQSSVVPTLGDEFVNKTFTDATYVDFLSNQNISGEKTFTNANTYINNTLTADTITATGDLTLNPVGNINCNGKTIDMTGGEIHKCPLIHSQNNNNIVVEGRGTGDIILKTNGINRVTIADNGVSTFSTLPQSSVVPTLGDELVNKTFTDATYVDLVNNETIGGVKTFTSLPQSSAVPTLGNDLINKTYGDATYASGAGFVTTNTTQSISGAKTFTTNTLKAEAGITVKNGASAQNATLTHNTTTLDIIGTGDISIKPTNDFNVLTGTGKNITVSTPSTSLLQSTQTFTTGITNTTSYIALESPTVYITGLNTQPNLIIAGASGTVYGLKITRGGTTLSAVNRINCSNTNDTLYIEINSGQNITLTDTAISFDVESTFNLVPTGTIIMTASSTVPAGYLYCNGTSVTTSGIYAKLFAVIGYTYGGSGSFFNKPNFEGCFLRGAGSQTVSGTTYTASALGTIQQDAVLNPLYASNEGFRSAASGARDCVSRDRITADPVDTNTGILPRFDRTATENRPVNHAVYYYIRY